MRGAEFKQAGYRLIDQIADFIDNISGKPVTTNTGPGELQRILGAGSLPQQGRPAGEIVNRASDLLCGYSLLNGHPKFLGYITSSAAPIGALADMLAAAVNPNVGAHILSPVATAIETQVIKWLVQFVGLPACFDGVHLDRKSRFLIRTGHRCDPLDSSRQRQSDGHPSPRKGHNRRSRK